LAVKPVAVIPMHRWDTNPEELKEKVEANSSIQVVVLSKGGEFQVV
jgi:hypothetical protein